MNERILQLRKTLKLTQEEFSKALGIKRSTLSGFENKTAIVTDRTVISICNVFNVSEDWLRHGKGDMFVKVNPTINEFFNIFDTLNPTLQEFLLNVANELLKTQNKLDINKK